MLRIFILGLFLSVSSLAQNTFTWATDSDPITMDPYSIYEINTTSFQGNIFEGLVAFEDGKIVPALATSWKKTSPTSMTFQLRKNVKFHDGSAFTADDVVFSLERVRSISGAGISSMLGSIKEIKKIDDHTISIVTERPNPLLLSELTLFYIMSKSWCEKNNATKTIDSKTKEENYATRHANGTGPFKLVKRETSETILERNQDWWNDAKHGIDKAILKPITNPATRTAALLAGELDFMMPVPIQSLDTVKASKTVDVMEGPENRVIFLCMNQHDDELDGSNIKGKNPFKDHRVRLAFAKAIDIKALEEKVMRGHSSATALIFKGVNGYDSSVDKRWDFDIEGAKKLLSEAGYADGFEVNIDCPKDRYVNDEQLCVAIAAMLSKIGIKLHVNAMDKAQYFKRVLSFKSPLYMMGWLPVTGDAHNALIAHVATRDGKSQGNFNFGGYSNPAADALIKKIGEELDTKKRNALIKEVSALMIKDVSHIPLHQQNIFWAKKKTIEVPLRADNYFLLQSVRYKK